MELVETTYQICKKSDSIIEVERYIKKGYSALNIRLQTNQSNLEDSVEEKRDQYFIFNNSAQESSDQFVFSFHDGSFKECNLLKNYLKYLDSPHLNDPLSSNLALYIIQELTYRPNKNKDHLNPMIITLMSYLERKQMDHLYFEECKETGLTPFKLKQIQEYVIKNIDQQISINDIAKISGLSICHFIRMFKRTTGETPHKFINRLKMEKAKELLKENERSIIQIGFALGFDNPSHFTQVFKSFFGITPLKFRKSILLDIQNI